VAHSRMALLFNGIIKIPMQFSILFLGAILFIFYQFNTPPIFFNSVATSQIKKSNYSAQFSQLEDQYRLISEKKAQAVRDLAVSIDSRNPELENEKKQGVQALQEKAQEVRKNAIELIRKNDPEVDPSDTNYIFLSYVIRYFPAGMVGLILAVIFAASMSSTASELNALASTTVVDIYKRLFRKKSNDRHYLLISKIATLGWGLYAILLAEFASRLGSLIEAVNIVGSVFYGTILGIFLVGFYFPSNKGSATFYAAILAELLVLYCFFFTEITFLWYNVIGCLGVIIFSFILRYFFRKLQPATHVASAA